MRKIFTTLVCICLLCSISPVSFAKDAVEKQTAVSPDYTQAETITAEETEPTSVAETETPRGSIQTQNTPTKLLWGIPLEYYSLAISAFAVGLSIVGFWRTIETEKRTQWSNAKDFFNHFDSFEVRSSRRRVYEAIENLDRMNRLYAIKNTTNIVNGVKSSVEDDVCYMISLYDAHIRMMDMHLLPMELLQGSALWTAVSFFILVTPYIIYRRNHDNPYYACFYVNFMRRESTDNCIKSLKNGVMNNPSECVNQLYEDYRAAVENLREKQSVSQLKTFQRICIFKIEPGE